MATYATVGPTQIAAIIQIAQVMPSTAPKAANCFPLTCIRTLITSVVQSTL